MSNVVSFAQHHDWKWHRDRIVAAWGKHVESIVQVGQCLIEAKDDLKHGAFMVMIRTEIPAFGQSAANRLMKIAEHPILSKCAHAHTLPASWMTLYELTKLPHEVLLAGLKDGSINPKTKRKDLLPMTQKAKKEEKEKPKPVEPVEPKQPMTIEEMCEQAHAQWHAASKDDRMRVISKLMKALDLNIHDWVVTMPMFSSPKKGRKK